MAEEVIKKKGRLAAAVLAGSSLAFGSFALSMPAALAAEAQEPPTEEVTEPADLDTQDDAPAGDGDEGTDSVDESQEADEADESETEASSEPSSEPEASENTDASPTIEANSIELFDADGEPTISLDVSSGQPGETVTAIGQGFTPNASIVLSLVSDEGSLALGTDESDENGAISVEVTIPADAEYGEYVIDAVEEQDNASASFQFTVVEDDPGDGEPGDEVNPALYVTPGAGPAGSTVGLNGTGFTANGDVEVTVTATDGSSIASITITADEYGTINAEEITIPEGTAVGLYQVTAVDVETDETSESVPFNVTDVTLTVNPESLSEDDFLEDGVELTVQGLEPNEEVDFEFSSRFSLIPSLAGEATADDEGTATYSVTSAEDDVVVGDYGVRVTLAEDELEVASGSFNVTRERPQYCAAPEDPTADGAVRPGEILYVTGINVTPDSTVMVDFGIDGVAEEELETEADGNFGTVFEVPEDAEPGVKELTVTDGDAVGTAEYTVADVTDDAEPSLTADRDQIPLEEFVGSVDDEPGVHFAVTGLEADTEINYNVTAPETVRDLDGEETADADGNAGFYIYGPETLDPTVYLGDYSVTVTYEDEQGETQTLGPVDFTVVEDGPLITLESDEVYPGESLDMQVTNLSPDGEVTVEWNPTETMRADADGNLEAELPIADDAEPGVYELTVTDEESGESNSVDYTVLSVDDPALTIDPETITLDEFIGDPEDGAGVTHVVENLEPGDDISYVVSGPEGVNDYESTADVDEEGQANFVIRGYETANNAVYLGDYTTVVTYEDEDGNSVELTGHFTVVTGDDAPGVGSDDDEAAAPAGGAPTDLNGTSLADTGASGAQLGLLAGTLLLAGGAFLAYANRGRLFTRKH